PGPADSIPRVGCERQCRRSDGLLSVAGRTRLGALDQGSPDGAGSYTGRTRGRRTEPAPTREVFHATLSKEDAMRLALMGSAGHWHTYAPAMGRVPGLTLVAVAAAGPEETTGAFDHAPGLTVDTRRYDDARTMLDTERLDVVQICGRNDRIPAWARIC